MSRRSRGHRGPRPDRAVRGDIAPRPAPAVESRPIPPTPFPAPGAGDGGPAADASRLGGATPMYHAAAPVPSSVSGTNPFPPAGPDRGGVAAQRDDPGARNGNGHGAASLAPSGGTTAAQLRRFIKSRSWVPMHELRRRFGINGAEDDVTPVAVDSGTIYVGLPTREGKLLGELLRAGDIGYELSVDPASPVVIGVYPMRPVPRH